MKNSIAFLTIIPVAMDTDGVAQAAAYMPLFPLIGATVGLIVGVAVRLFEFVLPSLPSAAIGVGLLLLVNGVQHMDGLLDFGDGLMFHGTRSGKLKVMRDPAIGAGGVAFGLVVLLITFSALAAFPSALVAQSLIVSEAAATFGMVLATGVGRSAHRGMNTVFVEAMHHERGLRLGVSCVIALAVSYFALGAVGLFAVLGVAVTAVLVVAVSKRSFGGLTGDVLGATNEIARSVSLMLLLVFLRWV